MCKWVVVVLGQAVAPKFIVCRKTFQEFCWLMRWKYFHGGRDALQELEPFTVTGRAGEVRAWWGKGGEDGASTSD